MGEKFQRAIKILIFENRMIRSTESKCTCRKIIDKENTRIFVRVICPSHLVIGLLHLRLTGSRREAENIVKVHVCNSFRATAVSHCCKRSEDRIDWIEKLASERSSQRCRTQRRKRRDMNKKLNWVSAFEK